MSLKLNNIRNVGKVGSDYFSLKYNRKSNTNISFYLEQFDLDNYLIYKRTSQQREITKKDFLDFKFSGYIFFKKSKFDKDYINMWL